MKSKEFIIGNKANQSFIKSILLLIMMLCCLQQLFAQSMPQTTKIFRDLEEVMKNPSTVYRLDLSGMMLKKFPHQIFECQHLQELDLSGNQLKAIPSNFTSLRFLRKLNLSGNRIKEVPESLMSLQNLEHLNLSSNRIETFVTANFSPQLRSLDVSNNMISEFAVNQVHDELLSLDISRNKIRSISGLNQFSALRYLYIGGNPIPSSNLSGLKKLQKVRYLSFSHSNWSILPSGIYSLENLVLLDLSYNRLTYIPQEIVEMRGLKFLILSNNEFSRIPGDLQRMKRLSYLDLSSNKLTTIPSQLLSLNRLKSLGLGDNEIKYIPDGIDELTSLRNLYLWGNPINGYSSDFLNLPQLDTLVLDDMPHFSNQLIDLALNFPKATISYYNPTNQRNFVFYPLKQEEYTMLENMNTKCESNNSAACLDLARFFEKKGRLGLATSYYKLICDGYSSSELKIESCLALGELYEKLDGRISVEASEYSRLISKLKRIRAFNYYEKVCNTKGTTKKTRMLQGKGCGYCQKFLTKAADDMKNRFDANQREIKRLTNEIRNQEITTANLNSQSQQYELQGDYLSSSFNNFASSISTVTTSAKEGKRSRLKAENERLEKQIKLLNKEANKYLSKVK